MWLFTIDGFFSAVAHPDDPDTIVVRARDPEDARRLAQATDGRVVEPPQRDYRYRVHLPRSLWSAYVAEGAEAIDYPNFKSAVGQRRGGPRASLYSGVWSVMYRLQPGD